VLAPRFEFRPKRPDSGPLPGVDYGPRGYDPDGTNVGFHEEQGKLIVEIKGLAEPKSEEARRIIEEDLHEVIAAALQDKELGERGLFDEDAMPQELTQVRMGKIIRNKYPELDEEDIEAIRQRAVAALNMVQQAKQVAMQNDDEAINANTAFIDGVRRFAMDVRELDIDLIDSINPFSQAYAILSKTMNEERLRRISEIITAKKIRMDLDEARELARRAVQFKRQHGRPPDIRSSDPWERRMAEGVAYLVRMKKEALRNAREAE